MAYQLKDGIEFMRSLPDQSVDGVFTDPPWGKGPEIAGQEIWTDLIGDMTLECARVLKPGGRVLIWVGMRMLSDCLKAIWGLEYRWAVFCYYVPSRYLACFEARMDPILFFSLPGEKYPNRPKKIRQLYQKVTSKKRDTLHPCARPFETVQHILSDWFDPGEYVIDPFAGSDTTGVACRQLGIESDTCEVDPMMFKTGVERNRQMILLPNSEKAEV